MDILGAIHRARGSSGRQGADGSLVTTARLVSTDGNTATIRLWDSTEHVAGVPAVSSTYTGVESVYVLLERGRPVLVAGPASSTTEEEFVPDESTSTTSLVRGRVILPTSTGTYAVARSAWDRYNTDRYGGVTDMYQGVGPIGDMDSLATYGDQFLDLGAVEITRARLTLISNGSGPSSAAWTATIQASASGSRPAGAPSYTGGTFTASVAGYGGAGTVTRVDLSSTVREGLRDGSLKGLGLVGVVYGGGTWGLSTSATRPSGWVIDCDYTVTV